MLLTNKQELMAHYPTCYACQDKRKSMEHAPPQCFFPKAKDEQGNYLHRKDLIKVPSYDVHNSQKSGDDLYALWHLATAECDNPSAFELLSPQLDRMANRDWQERGGSLMKRILSEIVEFSDGRPVGRVDPHRMQSFMRHCARAVYFYETQKKLLLPLKVTNLGNDFRNPAKLEELRKRERFFDSEVGASTARGANPEIFQYSIQEKSNDIILVRLIFYGHLKHWVFYHPEAREGAMWD